MKKDKVKVLEEVLSEDRIKEFLNIEAPEGENADFHRLLKAYRGMPPQYFEVFLGFFKQNGGDINASSKNDETLLSIVKSHKQSEAYTELLTQLGAK